MSKGGQQLFQGRAYYGLVFLAYLAFFISIFPDVVFLDFSFVKRDVLRYYYPVWRFAVESIKSGVIPFWNPYNNYGAPFLANVQSCVFYPFSLLLYLPWYGLAFNLYILVHLALAGFFTCLWMRDCGASKAASFLSGTAFALSGYVFSAISLTISLCSVVYFPLALLCFRRSFRDGSPRWKALAGLVLTFQYLAGDPAIVFSTLFVGTVFTFYKSVELSVRRRRLYLGHAVSFASIVVIFLGLSAFHMLAFAEFLSHTNRSSPHFNLVTVWSMQYNDIVSFFFPFFSDASLFFLGYWTRQSWLENYYVGITVFALAFLAWRYRRTDLVGYHVLLALVGVTLALGRFTLFYNLLYEYFPFMKFIRYPIRFVYVTHFAMACLAGFGLDALLAECDRRRRAKVSLESALRPAAGVALLTLGVGLSMVFAPRLLDEMGPPVKKWLEGWTHHEWTLELTYDFLTPLFVNLKRTMVLVLFCAAGVLAALHFKVRKLLLASYFFLLVFADLAESNVIELRLPRAALEGTGKNMDVVLRDKGIFRTQASPSATHFQSQPPNFNTSIGNILSMLRELLIPNLLLPHHVAYAAGYDSLYIKEAFVINACGRDIINPAEYRYLDMLNIKYVVSLKESLDPSYRKVQESYPGHLYLNENALPRAFLVPKAVRAGSHEAALDLVVEKSFDPLAQVYLEEEVPEPREAGVPAAEDAVEIEHYGLNEVRMRVSSRRAQWLFFSDMYYPGWRAHVDGAEARIYRANFGFRAVPVPAGHSIVRWKYDPVSFKIGFAVSSSTALALAAVWLSRRRRWPRSR